MSSAFGELLRRSRFASYDSAIPQAYCAPQAHARRGDYGFKRALPFRYKDSSITVSHVDHHAQFTNWNNASPLVRFVNRVQELNFTPRTVPPGSWDQSLGDAKLYWLIDSEFASNHHSRPLKSKSASGGPSEPLNLDSSSDPEPFDTKFVSNSELLNPELASNSRPRDGLGRLGSGAYGARRPPPQQSTYTPNPAQLNIISLSPRKFKAYLAKLHTLSASYRDYLLDQQNVRHSFFEQDSDVLYLASQPQFSPQKFHRSFLAKHFSATSPPISVRKSKKITTPTVSVSQNIERQPHRNGGLMYTHFSPLETTFTTSPQLGFVFQEEPQPASKHFTYERNRSNANYLSLVGGIVANLQRSKADIYLPFYNPYHDVAVGGKSIQEVNPLPLPDPAPGSFSDLTPAPAPAPELTAVPVSDPAPRRGTISASASKLGPISFNEPLQPIAPLSPPSPARADEVDQGDQGEQGDPFRLQKAIAPIRIITFALRSPPTAIATYRAHLSNPKDLLKSVSVSLSSAVIAPKLPTVNPHRIGSMEYSGHIQFDHRNRFDRGVTASRYGASASMYGVTYPLANKEGVRLSSRPASTSYTEQKKSTNSLDYEAMFLNKRNGQRRKWNLQGKQQDERLEVIGEKLETVDRSQKTE